VLTGPLGSTGPTANASARSRPWVAVALVLTVALGLLSRRYPLPGILAEYTGDALYTAAAFAGFALLFAAASTLRIASLAFLFSVTIECSQLLGWPWLVDLRGTLLGRLVLGQGFQWADLLAYLIGAIAAAAVEVVLRGRHVRMA
jgi:hypothetical protein